MRNKYIQECIKLSEKMMMEYYQGDASCIIEHLHDQCLYVGYHGEDFYFDKEMITKMLRRKEKHLSMQMVAKEFQNAAQERQECIVVGRYQLVSKQLYRSVQRVTFVWKEREGKLMLYHIHVSNPVKKDVDEEVLSRKGGAICENYLTMLLRKEIEHNRVLSIKDHSNRHHSILISDIYYCEAFNANTMVHTANGNIFARVPLKKMQESIVALDSEMFIRIHKTFLINKFYVDSITRYELQLANQFTLPISKEKYADIRGILHL